MFGSLATTVGYLDDYTIAGTVRNDGTVEQPGDTLQSVGIFMDGQRLDTRSIPPLKPGESYHFTYVDRRSRSAGAGTTTLAFRLIDDTPGSPMPCPASKATIIAF